jgi:hypothetical protein
MSEHGWLDDLLAKEESRHPVPAGLRNNVVATVTAEHTAEPRTSRLLVLAAAALVAVVVGTLIAIGRLAHPPTGVPVQRATPVVSPTPAEHDYGPVPAGVAVAYAIDPRQPTWLIAYDAAGRPVGTVKLPEAVDLSGGGQIPTASPGGDLIFAGDKVYDRSGQPIAPWSFGKGREAVADDQRHLCAVIEDQNTFENTLVTQAIGQPDHTVRVINREQGLGQTGENVVLCSFKFNVAVVVRIAIAWPTDAWFVRLSDGAVLHHLSFPAQAYRSIVASADGAYVAEGPSGSTSSQQLRVVRVSDGAMVAALGDEDPVQFVGDHEILTGTQAMPMAKSVSLVDWTTGRTVWSYSGSELVDHIQPVGTAFVVSLTSEGSSNSSTVPRACDRLLFVGADGAQRDVTGVNLYPVESF